MKKLLPFEGGCMESASIKSLINFLTEFLESDNDETRRNY